MVDRSSVPPSVKRVVHMGSRTFGRLTSGQRMLPSFLIAGGQRCGTTSMHRALSQHPTIFKAVLHKGVHYFDTDYHRGMSWYRGHFPLQRTARAVQERTGITPITFESSPYYMYHPLATERIANDLPGVKIICLVRDPVERAYSQHAHEVARDFEPEKDFVRAR
jgi:sulfotransferase family protein